VLIATKEGRWVKHRWYHVGSSVLKKDGPSDMASLARFLASPKERRKQGRVRNEKRNEILERMDF
jgi:hypothetical protein